MKEISYGFYRYGEENLKAFQIIDNHSPEHLNMFAIKYYLLCRSIELFFKSFLLERNERKEILRKKEYGHNLENILNLIISKDTQDNLSINMTDAEIIRMINPYYSNKEFEYIEEGSKRLPRLIELEKLSIKMKEKIKQIKT